MNQTNVVSKDALNAKTRRQARQHHRIAVANRWLSNLFTVFLYIIIFIVFFIPLAWALGNSFRLSPQIWSNAFPISLKTFIPLDGVTLQNYLDLFGLSVIGRTRGINLAQNLLVSAGTSICVVCCSLLFNTSAAYFFARLKFPGKKYLLVYVLITMMIPQQIVTVPLFMVVKQLGLYNTFWAMVVPWYSSPFIVFALTQFLSELPYELDEAAIIDGANYWQILWQIIIPNSLPGLITVCLLEFQFIWNEFYWPLVIISDRKLQPIQVAIAMQFSEGEANWGRVFAAVVCASVPVIALFLALQKYYFENIAMSGIKG